MTANYTSILTSIQSLEWMGIDSRALLNIHLASLMCFNWSSVSMALWDIKYILSTPSRKETAAIALSVNTPCYCSFVNYKAKFIYYPVQIQDALLQRVKGCRLQGSQSSYNITIYRVSPISKQGLSEIEPDTLNCMTQTLITVGQQVHTPRMN